MKKVIYWASALFVMVVAKAILCFLFDMDETTVNITALIFFIMKLNLLI